MNTAEFIKHQLDEMSTNICRNYQRNMEARKENPFLPLKDREIDKYMALGRSVESQLGNRIQNIIFYLARDKFGDMQTPNVISIIHDTNTMKSKIILYAVPFELDDKWKNKNFNPFKQYLYVNRDASITDVKKLFGIKSSCTSIKTETYYTNSSSTSEVTFHKKAVDLLTLNIENQINGYKGDITSVSIYEIKLGGNLDTKNSKANADEVDSYKKSFENTNIDVHPYFATCYGSCSNAVERKVKDAN